MERKKVNSTVAQSPEVVGEYMLLQSNATFNPFHSERSFRLECLSLCISISSLLKFDTPRDDTRNFFSTVKC
jgi:hypothetical protein